MLFLGSYSSSKLSNDCYDKNDARFWLAVGRSAGTFHVSSIGVSVGPVPWSAEGRPLEVDIGSDIGSRTSTMKIALVWTISSSRLVRPTAVRAPWMNLLRRHMFPRLLMPSGFALPPVECWRALVRARRRTPLRKAAPLPTAAITAVAAKGRRRESAAVAGRLVLGAMGRVGSARWWKSLSSTITLVHNVAYASKWDASFVSCDVAFDLGSATICALTARPST
jgi:hypothetical protein